MWVFPTKRGRFEKQNTDKIPKKKSIEVDVKDLEAFDNELVKEMLVNCF